MMGIRGQKQWHAMAVLGVACVAAAVVTVAAADAGRNTSLAGAATAPENATRHQGDGKAYHHVWPVTNTTTPYIYNKLKITNHLAHFFLLLCVGLFAPELHANLAMLLFIWTSNICLY